MRALITGGNGQLGLDLQRHLTACGDDVIAVGHSDLDVSDRDAVLQCIGAVGPDVVYHLAAWTNVDGCETDHQRAYLVNAMGCRFVAEGARLVSARVVAVSTDYVFDGSGPEGRGSSADQRGYTEWDPTGPISHYGRSKLGGEHEMATVLGPEAAVVRTAWVCGVNGTNFVKTMLRLAADPERKELTVVDDQRGCPTFTTDLAETLRLVAVNRLGGLFHASNAGPLTWCDFAKAIFTAGGFDAQRVVAIPTADLLPARPAPRPAFSVLDNAALRAFGFSAMRHWEGALAETVTALQSS
jgi:dTDP-4-dehydrorhamnose reductase